MTWVGNNSPVNNDPIARSMAHFNYAVTGSLTETDSLTDTGSLTDPDSLTNTGSLTDLDSLTNTGSSTLVLTW